MFMCRNKERRAGIASRHGFCVYRWGGQAGHEQQSTGLLHSNVQIPPDLEIKRTIRMDGSFYFWRSRRDLNPRYPFGVHTISSRARYDHFDTAPCGSALADLHILHQSGPFVKPQFYFFRKISLPGQMAAGAGKGGILNYSPHGDSRGCLPGGAGRYSRWTGPI